MYLENHLARMLAEIENVLRISPSLEVLYSPNARKDLFLLCSFS